MPGEQFTPDLNDVYVTEEEISQWQIDTPYFTYTLELFRSDEWRGLRHGWRRKPRPLFPWFLPLWQWLRAFIRRFWKEFMISLLATLLTTYLFQWLWP